MFEYRKKLRLIAQFGLFSCQSTHAGKKAHDFIMGRLSTNTKMAMETVMNEVQRVVLEKIYFGYREKVRLMQVLRFWPVSLPM